MCYMLRFRFVMGFTALKPDGEERAQSHHSSIGPLQYELGVSAPPQLPQPTARRRNLPTQISKEKSQSAIRSIVTAGVQKQ